MLSFYSITVVFIIAGYTILLFFNGATFLFLFLLYLGAILFLLGSPRRERINSIFITEKFPFLRWNNLFQLPKKKGLLKTGGTASCRELHESLKKTMYQMSKDLGRPGYYRTITHSSVKRILQHRVRQGKIKIIKCVPAYQRSFVHLQKQLLQNRCKGCPDRLDCPYYWEAPKFRQFYYIEFLIPSEKEKSKG